MEYNKKCISSRFLKLTYPTFNYNDKQSQQSRVAMETQTPAWSFFNWSMALTSWLQWVNNIVFPIKSKIKSLVFFVE